MKENEFATIIFDPDEQFYLQNRKWQGVPSIERTGKRLWATWVSGGKYEPCIDNYLIISYSDDDGETWVDPYAIIRAKENTFQQTIDSQLWVDDTGKLWLFWMQNTYPNDAVPSDYDTTWDEQVRVFFYKTQQWKQLAICCDNPTDSQPVWSEPRYVWDGNTRNNITVLKNGRWLVPAYKHIDTFTFCTNFMISDDKGLTFFEAGNPVQRSDMFCEPMIIQRNDDSLWCLIRTKKGYLDESFSYDNGETWTEPSQTTIPNPAARFHIGRLNNGMMLYISNPSNIFTERTGLVALLSDDDGQSWKYRFTLDDRSSTTYPDVAFNPDGSICIIYDCQRDNRQEVDPENPLKSNAAKEICMARLTAQDIMAGTLVDPKSYLRKVISKVYYDSREIG